jgi:hypothetical protein
MIAIRKAKQPPKLPHKQIKKNPGPQKTASLMIEPVRASLGLS